VHESVRKVWSEWFNSKGVQHLYFSAKDEQTKIDTDIDEEDSTKYNDQKKLFLDYMNTHKVINRSNLMHILKSLVQEYREKRGMPITPKEEDKIVDENNEEKTKKDIVTIGMCGFPNVGKSSIINVLCKKKLVGVDARPGKTKNYQTIFLDKEL